MKPIRLETGAAQMLYALNNQHGFSVFVCEREYLDNSLDAGAGSVSITYSTPDKTLVVSDDGNGTEEPENIVSPFKHGAHTTTASGRYGIGGTASMIWMTDAKGIVSVLTTTDRHTHAIVADFAVMMSNDSLDATADRFPSAGKPKGTSISIGRCTFNPGLIMQFRSKLEFLYTPTLRKKTKIILAVDDKAVQLEPVPRPIHGRSVKFSLVVDGHTVNGFCDMVKPGVKNPAKGFAVALGHRFMDTFREPAGDRNIDWSRLYAEITLPDSWDNVTDHKDGFRTAPNDLWAQVEERCRAILDELEQEAQSIELDDSIKAAQEILDMVTGHTPNGEKGRRGGPHEKEGTCEPTNNGSEHENFSKKQPGTKGGRPPKRILLNWASDLEVPYEIRMESRRIRVTLSEGHLASVFKGENCGEQLAFFVLNAVSAANFTNSIDAKGLFPNLAADSIAMDFGRMLSWLPAHQEA
jgi:hypothetical protein